MNVEQDWQQFRWVWRNGRRIHVQEETVLLSGAKPEKDICLYAFWSEGVGVQDGVPGQGGLRGLQTNGSYSLYDHDAEGSKDLPHSAVYQPEVLRTESDRKSVV